MSVPSAPESPHAVTAEDVLAALEVDPERGLSGDEAERRRREVGPNRVGDDEGVQPLAILWSQLADATVLLLVGATVVGFAVGEVIEAIAVLVVLVVNAIVGFVTEFQAARSMAALQQMASTTADVERDDRRDEIDAEELVPGDIVVVEAGERIPADLRLLEAEELTVEEAALTGESEAVEKGPDPVDEDAPLAERRSLAFMGTTVQNGRGRGVVIATGAATEVGNVAELAGSAEDRQAPLQRGLARLSTRLAVAVIVIAAALVGIGLLQGREVAEVAELAIALAIAVVPEGLPAVATLTLAVGMRRMSQRQALVRRLPAVETLGSTTAVCSDKTGTLTANRMDVRDVELAEGADEEAFWRAAVLCNDGDIDPDGDPVGDPTEVALLRAAGDRDLDWRELRETSERSREVPFDSETMRMAVVVGDTVHVKGAPEALVPQDHPLHEAAERMAGDALRALAIAWRDAPSDGADDDELFEGLELLGVVGMHDPPRPEVIEAVEELRAAGIRTIMITGDRADTAVAIAEALGLPGGNAVTGEEVEACDEEELVDLVREVQVFARVSPEQKLAIVAALHRAGEVVAVTGDGVNDAPALSQADVGVAMGSGTAVARDAADIVLLDDDLSTVVAAVEEGRRVFANIRRFAQFLFSWHLAEVVVIAVALLIGMPAPLAGLMILWNNLIIDVLPSFALALEPGRDEVMREPPRDPKEPVVSRAVISAIAAQGLLVAGIGLVAFIVAGQAGLELDGRRTATFVAMSAGQVLAVFNARSRHGHGFRGVGRNLWLWGALALTATLETVALTWAPLRDVLGLAPLPVGQLAVALGLALVPLAVVQGWRIVRDRPGDTAGSDADATEGRN